MKYLLLALTILTSQTHAAPYHGTGSSGGGGAYVCRDAQGKILNSELVDLWEAKNLFSRKTKPLKGHYMDIVAAKVEFFKDMDENIYDRMVEKLKFVQTNTFYLPKGVRLEPPQDVNSEYEKVGCPLAGMMYWDGNLHRLAIDKEVFDHLLSDTEKAAAIFHEIFYATQRDQNTVMNNTISMVHDSQSARNFVGCYFSTNTSDCLKPKATAPAPNTGYKECRSDIPGHETHYFIKVRSSPNQVFPISDIWLDKMGGKRVSGHPFMWEQATTGDVSATGVIDWLHMGGDFSFNWMIQVFQTDPNIIYNFIDSFSVAHFTWAEGVDVKTVCHDY